MIGFLPPIAFPPRLPALVEPEPDYEACRAADKAAQDRLAAIAAGTQGTVRDYRVAARLAGEVYPPAIARVLKAEFEDWCTFGFRLGVNAGVGELYDEVMADARAAGLA